MANITPRNPFLYKKLGNLEVMRVPVDDGGDNADGIVLQPGHFVTISGAIGSQVIKPTRDGANFVNVWGWCPDGKKTAGTATNTPPYNLPNNSIKHSCFHPQDQMFGINITDSSGNVGSSGPAGTAVTIGSSYGLKTVTVNSIPVQMLNKDNTTNLVFTVVELYPNQATTDKNPIVVVKIVDAAIAA